MDSSFFERLRRSSAKPLLEHWHVAQRSFTFTERVIFWTLSVLLLGSVVGLISLLNGTITVKIPVRTGSLTEGVVGTPRFINPLLALSDADRDVASLVYSGLLRATPEGSMLPDLADKYTVSNDGLTYTFTIRPNAVFHDGTPVTADDVVFTIHKAQDPALKSPKRPNWEGVLVQKVDDRTVQFTLKQAYAPFLENLTIGILPEHLWRELDSDAFPFSELNINPIGSGPYKVASVSRTSAGVPDAYTLTSFKDYALGQPYIQTMRLRFYRSEEDVVAAYSRREVESISSLSPEVATTLKAAGARVEHYPLPRVFGVFFNQNQAPVLADKSVRQALALAVDKNRIVDEVLRGFGTPIDSPLPPGIEQIIGISPSPNDTATSTRLDAARALLKQAGWTFDEAQNVLVKKVKKQMVPLAFSIATANAPELKRAAELVQQDWQALGARVDVKFFDVGTLNQEVIRPRKYDALLFGQIIGRDIDPFAFWHSSQRNDPGLNIALYANIKADKTLEQLRATQTTDARETLYRAFEKEIRNDVPAVFLYTPDFLYVVPSTLQGFHLGTVTTPAERFLNIYQWHTETESVWAFFATH